MTLYLPGLTFGAIVAIIIFFPCATNKQVVITERGDE